MRVLIRVDTSCLKWCARMRVDSMVRRLQELEGTSCFYEGLVERVRKYLRAHYAVAETHHELGDVFAEIGCKELQPAAAEAFTKFAESHRCAVHARPSSLFSLWFSGPSLRDSRTRIARCGTYSRSTVLVYLLNVLRRQLERGGAEFVRKASAVVGDFNTFLVRAIPDMRLTVNKYLDAKFEYLVFISAAV